jgi:hypothetical protein
MKLLWNEFGVIKHTWYGVSTQGVLSICFDLTLKYESAQIKLFSRLLVVYGLTKPFLKIKQSYVSYNSRFDKLTKFEKKIQNGRLKKTEIFKIANSQIFFAKISQIGPWVSRIDWCEGHWCGSMYMAVRLSDVSSKTAKKHKKCIFSLF